PDFRGPQGFWRAYPPYAALGLDFQAMANPAWFDRDPPFAWGFYGHRRNLYRHTQPHDGFSLLRRWAARMRLGGLVPSSTPTVSRPSALADTPPPPTAQTPSPLLCPRSTPPAAPPPLPADPSDLAIDEATFRAPGPLPSCPGCGALARPNILMFGDLDWDG